MRRAFCLIAVVAVLAAACAEEAPVGPGDAGEPGEPVTTTAGGGGTAAAGEALFTSSCQPCHGPGAVGIEGLGKRLAQSDFIGGLNDEDLVAFIAAGRAADDPANTTGIAMPPRGGNSSLSDDDLAAIVSYLRTLQ